ncbi:hypothetical protein, partial [Mycolicibacterium llatzerense]|uniref:hypothetical protein n=1 Tax=Mycolicibacterium llatzerense TaxID=280871 RepID=UPI0019550852
MAIGIAARAARMFMTLVEWPSRSASEAGSYLFGEVVQRRVSGGLDVDAEAGRRPGPPASALESVGPSTHNAIKAKYASRQRNSRLWGVVSEVDLFASDANDQFT